MALRKRLSVWYVIPPLYTLLTIWPPIVELPPLAIPSNFNISQVLIVLPFYSGLLASPGFLYAWSGYYDQRLLTKKGKIWVSASLWLAIISSIGGMISIVAVIPAPGVCGSLVSSVMLLDKFHRSGMEVSVNDDVVREKDS